MRPPKVEASARLARSLTELERRCETRRTCELATSWYLFGAREEQSWAGAARDISTGGIRLVLDQGLKPGTLLYICLRRPDDTDYRRPKLVRVRWATAKEDGTWVIGCSFVKNLHDTELHELL
jgi:hypothetical protein